MKNYNVPEGIITPVIEDAEEFDLNALDKHKLSEMLFRVGHDLMQEPALSKIFRDNKGKYFDKRLEDINFMEGAIFGFITILGHSNVPAFLTHKRDNFVLLKIVQEFLEKQQMGGGFSL